MESTEAQPSTSTPSTSNPGPSAAPDGLPQRKQLTKAERRELQEKQRAAKVSAAANTGSSGKTVQGQKQQQNQSQKPKKDGSGATPTASTSVSNIASVPSGKKAKAGRDADLAAGAGGTDKAAADLEALKKHQTRIFTHFVIPKKEGRLGAGIKGEIHPAIVRLGRQFADMKIVGANARCIATLVAFKTVIQDYITPQNLTLARDLTQYISPQISYLVSARPMPVGMGNAIRELKYHISVVSIDMPEQDAKDHLCEQIDTYISHRIVLADSVIEEYAMPKIQNGAVIMTFGRSSVVERVLIAAWTRGKRFSVKVVDSRPLLEGRNMLAQLLKLGIPCTYLLVNALGSVISEVSMIFLGAHAVNSNGSVYSRAGTALVAMIAKEHSVPVLILSETYKYSNNIQLDSFTKNELAPPLDPKSSFPRIIPREKLVTEEEGGGESLNLRIINPLYDLTPHSHITVLVTEVGLIPPSAISTLAGLRDKDKGGYDPSNVTGFHRASHALGRIACSMSIYNPTSAKPSIGETSKKIMSILYLARSLNRPQGALIGAKAGPDPFYGLPTRGPRWHPSHWESTKYTCLSRVQSNTDVHRVPQEGLPELRTFSPDATEYGPRKQLYDSTIRWDGCYHESKRELGGQMETHPSVRGIYAVRLSGKMSEALRAELEEMGITPRSDMITET